MSTKTYILYIDKLETIYLTSSLEFGVRPSKEGKGQIKLDLTPAYLLM